MGAAFRAEWIKFRSHASGTIAATIAAFPRRGRVAAAKTALIASIGLTAGTAVALGSFLLGQAAFASSPMRESLSSPGALRAIVGDGLVLTLVSLLGLGLGLLFRRAVAAMSTLVVLLYLLPPVTSALSAATRRVIVRYMPDHLAAPSSRPVRRQEPCPHLAPGPRWQSWRQKPASRSSAEQPCWPTATFRGQAHSASGVLISVPRGWTGIPSHVIIIT